jgi:Na+-driven multidrug efflux pump
MYFSLIGFVLMLVLNIWLVPLIGIPNGYMGSAWAAFISYFVIMVLSYFVGRKYYPIEYPVKRIMLYTLLAGILWGVGSMLEFTSMMWLTYLLRIILLAIYVSVIALKENVPVLSSLVHRLIRR